MEPERARELLRRERERVERELAQLRPAMPDGELADYDQHPADQGTETFEQELNEGQVVRLREELAAIERAERRLAEGTYGRSVLSGRPIPDARLERVPWAERTVDEAEPWRHVP